MTSKTSLFNKGIYLSNLRRFFWGSVIYFVILFLSTCLRLLLNGIEIMMEYSMAENSGISLILNSYEPYLALPLFFAVGVSTVVAVLVFRFLHSKRTAIFVHSLPVSRTANFVSTLAAAFTLMAVPVILNGLILMVMSFSGYGNCFDAVSCLIWIGINLLILFLLFSCSTFAAVITGNGFVLVGLNIIIHSITILIINGFSYLAEIFLYGYCNESHILQQAYGWNFVGYIAEWTEYFYEWSDKSFDLFKMVIMLAVATVIYVLSWITYKKRMLEKTEDVAAFKCLNPIFKYVVSLLATLSAFCIVVEENAVGAIVPTIIVSFIVYFGIEMLLKKSLKVWRAYVGYLGFLAFFSILVCTFAFTGFFGYETRVPKIDDVESVVVDGRYISTPSHLLNNGYEICISDKEVTEYMINFHKNYLESEQITFVKDFEFWETDKVLFKLKYNLKNGDLMTREYAIEHKTMDKIYEDLYGFDSYKKSTEPVFLIDTDKIENINIEGNASIEAQADIDEFIECLKSDILDSDGDMDYTGRRLPLSIQYKTDTYGSIENSYYVVTDSYKRTWQWIKDRQGE